MIRRTALSLIFIVSVAASVAAQEHVVVGTRRLPQNGPLFLAVAQGYFKAEGIDLAMTGYDSDQTVAERLAAGTTDFALGGFTPAAFNFAGKGQIKAVAAQAREKRFYEGSDLVVSNLGFARGLQKFENLANRSVAIDALGSVSHYQLEQIARVKHVDVASISVKPMQTIDAIARAIGNNQVDAAIMPAPYARELLASSQAKLLGWYSELDEQQLGALFASRKMIETRREVVEKFVRAYRRGVAEYATALLRKDVHSKRTSDSKSNEIATTIARYIYPERGASAAEVEAGAYFIEPQARLDLADIERQIAWYKSHGLIDKNVDARNVVDQSFIK